MVFWGCEVKPGKMVQEVPPPPGYTLHVTQATLGQNPKDGERTVVKCRTRDKEWIYLCSLTGGAAESCQLDLMFEGEVTFAISGKTSVHLVGYLMPSHDHDHDDDEDDEYELDYTDEDEDEDDDMDGDEDDDSEDESDEMEIPNRKSGVVIEEVEDEPDTPAEKTEEKKDAKVTNGSVKKENGEKAKKGKAPAAAVKEVENKDGESDESEEEDEEDEDGFMAAKKRPAKKAAGADSTEAKRQAVAGKEADKPTAAAVPAKTPPPASKGGAKVEAAAVKATPGKTPGKADAAAAKGGGKTPGGEAKTPGGGEAKTPGGGEAKTPGGEEAKTPAKDRLFVKTFPNGFKIETVALGRPDAKAAKPGSRVFVKYVGRFKSNDKIFDSSKGPFSFRLGVGEVIKGWDVGLQGMRVGDKRKLTVPPAMGYGVKGAPPQIPGNSWLLFDVELCDVK